MIRTPSLGVFRHRAFAQFWVMRICNGSATQMLAVAIGLQVYDLARLTRTVEQSALILGLVGLTQFLPLLLLSLVGGVAADRLDRKAILVISLLVRASVVFSLFLVSDFAPSAALPSIFIAAAVIGGLNAFTPAAASALLPRMVPRAELPQAIAWNSLAFQGAAMVGPAIAGLLYVGGPQTVYGACIALLLISAVLMLTAPTPRHERIEGLRTFAMMIEGIRYVRDNKIVLGAISLDLIVVLFGGATALLPVFARDVLHVGPEGMGLLRAAPAVGAAIVAFWLAAKPLARRVGFWMLAATAIFGAAMLAFAASGLFWLSLLALAVTGAGDMISVYVRQSLIQLATPDAMRGRVASVSFIFISASNELGEFESGVAARFLGPIGAVVLGGMMAIGSALAWTKLFPELAKADRFEDAVVAEEQAAGAAAAAAAPSPSLPPRPAE